MAIAYRLNSNLPSARHSLAKHFFSARVRFWMPIPSYQSEKEKQGNFEILVARSEVLKIDRNARQLRKVNDWHFKLESQNERRTKMATSVTEKKMTEKKAPEPRNGVDTPTLFATINAVGAQPELGKFKFRATNRWQEGTHSRSSIQSFYGAGAEQMHEKEFVFDGDHPAVLVGRDQGPTPVEFLLHSLASCLTAGIGNIAAARGVTLHEVESTVEGDIDLRAILGLTEEVRNGYQGIRVNFKIKGDAPAEKLEQIVEQSRKRSAVYDVLTNGVPISITVNAG